MTIKIRAHHLLCIPRFYGGGYNTTFGRNLKDVCLDIRKDPNVQIEILQDVDVLCHQCPHEKEGICQKTPSLNYWILAQDNKVLKKLNIKKDSLMTAREIFNLSVNEIPAQEIKSICQGCGFLDACLKSGINKSFIKDINKQKTK